MCLETWKQEFYPIPADDPSLNTDILRLEHSIRKWEGLLPENLNKHGLIKESSSISDRICDSFNMCSYTCSLCVAYLIADRDKYNPNEMCIHCPIVRYRSYRCDRIEGNISPPFVSYDERTVYTAYTEFTANNNPLPMITLLKETLEYVKRQEATTNMD